jgi:NADH-quinone oxidoreductase subunit C
MNFETEAFINSITSHFEYSIYKSDEFRDEVTFYVKKDKFLPFCKSLYSKFGFKYLVDITAVDYLQYKTPRYEMVYIFHRFGENYNENIRIRVKVELKDNDNEIDTVTKIWSGADWLEREVYDMFGIKFTGHPDLRRILMPEDYPLYPLRKDFDVRDRKASKECFERELKEGLG